MKIITATASKPTMESKLAIQNGGQVAISERGEEVKPKHVSPQLFGYYMFLCVMSVFFSIPSVFFHSKRQALKQHPSGVFVIMTFVSMSVTIMDSGILVLTSCYLKSYMRIVHYTILKAVGSMSAILAPFFFEVALFVPENPSKTVYTLIGVVSVGIVVSCCFYWKYALSQQPTDFNELDSPWMLLNPVPIPLMIVLSTFIPDNLYWIVDVVFFVQISILCVGVIKMILRIHVMSMEPHQRRFSKKKRQDQ